MPSGSDRVINCLLDALNCLVERQLAQHDLSQAVAGFIENNEVLRVEIEPERLLLQLRHFCGEGVQRLLGRWQLGLVTTSPRPR